MKLILASTSPYRRQILAQLKIPFDTDAPAIDETPRPDEKTADYVCRLALEKARVVAARHPDSLVIGSDQACSIHGLPLGKPHSAEAAVKHLKMCAGNWVEFITGLALVGPGSDTKRVVSESFKVKFRRLDDADIRAYVAIDNPLDCAGSFKVESAGIALFEALEGRDYNTLLGLPMLALVDMLLAAGVNPLRLAAESVARS